MEGEAVAAAAEVDVVVDEEVVLQAVVAVEAAAALEPRRPCFPSFYIDLLRSGPYPFLDSSLMLDFFLLIIWHRRVVERALLLLADATRDGRASGWRSTSPSDQSAARPALCSLASSSQQPSPLRGAQHLRIHLPYPH